jgi:hypothetical protein
LDFHFCGVSVVKKPYCDHHRAVAFRPNRAVVVTLRRQQRVGTARLLTGARFRPLGLS